MTTDPSARSESKPPEPSATILLVDDRPANLLALEAVLADLGHTLVKAGSGEEALRLLLEEDFVVVLLDVQMPGLDGFETAKLIRSRERSRHTPIVFLTAHDDNRLSAEQAYALGAVDYLVKPLVPVILRAKVAGFVSLFEQSEQIKRQAERLRQAEGREFERRLADQGLRVHEQREWLRVALASIGDAVIATDRQARVTFLNPVAESLTGWTRREAEGEPLERVFPIYREGTREPVEHPVARVLREGVVVGLANHTVLVARDGTERPIDDSAAPIRDDRGEITGVILVFRDVAERRKAERAVRESEARKAAILTTALDCIITIDHQGNVLDFNPAAERTFGYRRADVLGREMAEFIIPPAYRDRHREGMARYLATGEGPALNRRVELTAVRADGTEFPVELAITRIPAEGPAVFTGYLRDISDRRRAERRHDARLAFTQVLSQGGPVEEVTSRVLQAVCEGLGWDAGIFWRADPSAGVLRCGQLWHGPSPRFEAYAAACPHETFGPGVGLPGRVWGTGQPAWIADVLADPNFPRAALAAAAGLCTGFGVPVRLGPEVLGVFEFFSDTLAEPDADLLEMMDTIGAHFGQFLERREAEERLRRSQRELADFVENATVGLHWVGPDGTILWANQAELDLLGYTREEYIGHHIAEFHADPPAIEDILCRLTNKEVLDNYEARLRCKDGSIRHVVINSNVLWDGERFVHTRCFTRDITERKHAEQALRESEERLRTLSNNLPHGAIYQVLADPQGGRRFTFMSAGVGRLFGVPAAEAMADATALYGLIHEEDRPRVAAAEEAALRDLAPYDCEFRSRTRTGDVRWFHCRSAPRRLPAGEVAWEGIIMDVTDRRRSETALEERAGLAAFGAEVGVALVGTATLRGMLARCAEVIVRRLDAAFARVWTLDEAAGVLELQASAGLYTHIDGPHSRVPVGRYKIGLIAQERKPHLTNAVQDDPRVHDREWARREGMVAFAGYPLLVGDRLVGVMAMFARRALSEATLEAMAAVANGIALGVERQRAEGRLREEHRIAETLNRIGGILAAELDLKKLVQSVTDEATRITDAAFGAFFYNVADERGESYTLYTISGVPREAFERFPMPRNTAIFSPTFRGEGAVRLDDVTQDPRYGQNAPYFGMPEGHLPVRSYLAVPVVSRRGDVLGGLFFGHSEAGVFSERDERIVVGIAAQAAVAIDNARLYQESRTAGEQLRRTNAELAAAARHKDEFLAMLAHELRNPLAPIRNGLHVLEAAGVTEPVVTQAAGMMARQVNNLVRLVDDLLDVSRITRGRIELRKAVLDLGTAVRRAVETSRPLIDAGGHELTVLLPPEPVYLEADPTRLEQVVSNLLNNAAKYTEPGGHIRVSASREGGEAVIRVRDDGIGIHADLLPRLFDLFTQAERSLDRSQGGLGIGLALVRSLVEMHGGCVTAASDGLGRGSEFIVRLPALAARAGTPGAENPAPQGRLGVAASRRVLVVDDNADAADSAAILLGLWGLEVRTVYDGPAALEAARDFRPQVVLLDLGLPRMNGFEVARRLRQEMGRAVLLVALSGYGQEADRSRSRQAGFDHHLVKPLEPDALQALLESPGPLGES
jgi:PAS domain S-box-containing protein